jgi:5-methylcytosine-specific restriction endonuclease McrA
MRHQYIPTEKPCTKCGEVKPLSEFPKAKDATHGVRSYCKVCHAAQNRAYNRRVKEESPERVRAWGKANYENHKERHREGNRRWEQANPDKVREINERKNKRNRHIKMRWEMKRRGIPDEGVTRGALLSIRAYFDDRCAYCQTKLADPAFDHIVPRCANGPHHPDNLVPVCKSCNSKKHAASLLVCLLEGRLT